MQILTIRNGIEVFDFKNEPFESNSKHSNANFNYSKHSNADSNHLKEIRSIQMQILTIRSIRM